MPETDVNVGLLLAHAPGADVPALRSFVERLAEDTRPELEAATGAAWHFHRVEASGLSDDNPRRPSDFLDEASLRMVEGPYDIVIVLTDVALVSRRHAVVAGLASHASHIAVLSLRKLLISPRGKAERTLRSEAVRWNAATLLLHLTGHLLGLGHARDPEDAMAPFGFTEDLDGVRRFSPEARARLREAAARSVEREWPAPGRVHTLGLHLLSAARHLPLVLRTLLRNRAPLLPLALPSLATAAVIPAFILVFTAEIWDVGLNLPSSTAWGFALASILAAATYLTRVQNLFFPRKEKRVLVEYLAVVNVTIFLTILLAVLGLFVLVGALMLLIELYVFPPGLISTWPTLEDPVVDLEDKIRLAGFMSTIGVLTGALGGGLESRTLIRHLALFLDEP